MSHEEDALGPLAAAGVLDALEWAFLSSARRVRADLGDERGYDATAFGSAVHSVLRDRLDRVFSCREYQLPPTEDSSQDLGRDVVLEGLDPQDLTTMPVLPAGLVIRSNRTGSPGWRHGDTRVFLASAPEGVPSLDWRRRGPTKQQLAQQGRHASFENTLFALLDETQWGDGWGEGGTGPDGARCLDLVMAYSLDPVTGDARLAVGLPRFNDDGGASWVWLTELFAGATDVAAASAASVRGSFGLGTNVPSSGASLDVPDAPVRLRKPQNPEEGQG